MSSRVIVPMFLSLSGRFSTLRGDLMLDVVLYEASVTDFGKL